MHISRTPPGNQILHTHCSCWYVSYLFDGAAPNVDPENDWDIPHSHSSALFDAFLETILLEAQANSESSVLINSSDLDTESLQPLPLPSEQRDELVSRVNIHNFGTLDEFAASGRRVALLMTVCGKHDIPKEEGVQDTIRRMFELY